MDTPDKQDIQLGNIEDAVRSTITSQHRTYLLERHGTLDLEPIPSMSPDDPLNWPVWRKNIAIAMVAIHGFVNTLAAASVISAFALIAERYDISINKATYLCSVQILFLGIFPLLWNPVAERYGRRPVYILSAFLMFIFNLAGGFCKSYGSQMTTRVLFSIFACPPLGFGSAVATELFFARERAQKIGWWALMITLGIPLGPLVFGFVVENVGLDWLFWILACVNFAQLLGYVCFNTETIYNGSQSAASSKGPFRIIVSAANQPNITVSDQVQPLRYFTYYKILVPAVSYAVVFTYTTGAIVVNLPTFYVEKYRFTVQQIGLQYIAVLTGAGLGEQLGGPLSDFFLRQYRRNSRHHCPEQRLWVTYIGFAAALAGSMVWGIQLEKADTWNITPLVGAAVANFGCQVVTTTLITFCVDCYRESSGQIGVFINIIRQIWTFLGPFYFPDMYKSLGLVGGSGLLVGLMLVLSVVPVAAIHITGEWRLHRVPDRQ